MTPPTRDPRPSPAQVRAEHHALLSKWRRAMNLVGPGPIDPHLDDAEAAVQALRPRGTWADLGSGAGFPGVALAAWHPHVHVVLVESRGKRARFLERLLRRARLPNAEVAEIRAEQLPERSFDGVIARAFAPPPTWLPLAARLLRSGGTAVVMAADSTPPAPPAALRHHASSGYRVGDRRRWLHGYLRT